MQDPPRVATLVLVDPDGRVLGRTAPFTTTTPWWQDIGPVVVGAREGLGVEVTVLRMLETEQALTHGGAVTYLAEVEAGAALPPLTSWDGALTEDPLRHPYARPGGPAADLAWARGVLDGLGASLIAPPEQFRTWNLSSIWRLPTTLGNLWLKVVPPFFGHEGDIIERLRAEDPDVRVPQPLGHDGPRLLLAEIPGHDRYDADLDERLVMVDLLVALQARWVGRVEDLLAIGLPDWRSAALTARIADVVDRKGWTVDVEDRATLARFIADLPRRWAEIANCGLPDGLVHGDYHPGNLRGDGVALTILDWGDAGVGHPMLDQPAFLAVTPEAELDVTKARWSAAWRRVLPEADPDRAATLLRPIAAARQAVIYVLFLDNIEATEQPYHTADVPLWLHWAAEIVRGEGAT